MTRTTIIAFATFLSGAILGWGVQHATDYRQGMQWKLQEAASRGDVNRMKEWISAGADPRAQPMCEQGEGSSPLFVAASLGHPDAVEFLISRGADVNLVESTETPLDMAQYRKVQAEKTIQILKSHGAKGLLDLPGMKSAEAELNAARAASVSATTQE